jgi:hypothetical protein
LYLDGTIIPLSEIWPIAKCPMKGEGQKIKTDIHSPSGLKYHTLEKTNKITGCLENQFTHHDSCDGDMKGGWRLEFKVYSKL